MLWNNFKWNFRNTFINDVNKWPFWCVLTTISVVTSVQTKLRKNTLCWYKYKSLILRCTLKLFVHKRIDFGGGGCGDKDGRPQNVWFFWNLQLNFKTGEIHFVNYFASTCTLYIRKQKIINQKNGGLLNMASQLNLSIFVLVISST